MPVRAEFRLRQWLDEHPAWRTEGTGETPDDAQTALAHAATTHAQLQRVEKLAAHLRAERDQAVRHSEYHGITKYKIAQRLRTAESTIGRIIAKTRDAS